MDHLNRKGTRLKTDGDAEPLACDSSLCQKTHCESQDEVRNANDERILLLIRKYEEIKTSSTRQF